MYAPTKADHIHVRGKHKTFVQKRADTVDGVNASNEIVDDDEVDEINNVDSINYTDDDIRDVIELDSEANIEDVLGVVEFGSEDDMSSCESDDED